MEGVMNFTNIDEEDFEGMYHGEKIVLRSGQTKAFTEKQARHLAGQLVHKILTRQKRDYLLDPERDSIIAKMLGAVVAPEPEPIIPPIEEKVEAKEEVKEEEFPEIKKVAKKRGRKKTKK